MSWIDWSIVIAFVIYALYSGIRCKGVASKNLEEYFLAGRSLKGWQAGLSMAATQFASDTPLLVTGLIATAGIFSLWQMWIYALSFLFMGFVLAPCWRRANVLTDAEFTELRYGKAPAAVLRIIKAFYFGTLFNCTVLAWVFFAATRIAEPFLLWNEWLPAELFGFVQGLVESVGVPMVLNINEKSAELWILSTNNFISILGIVMVTFFYSATGGLRAVVATDIFQLFIMLAATLGFAIVVVLKLGGLSALGEGIQQMFSGGGPGGILPDQILAFTPDQALDASGPLLLVFALQWLIQLNSDGTGYLAQRSMACRSDKDAKMAAIVFSFTQVLLRSLLWLPIGVGLLLLFPPDLTLPLEVLRAEREASFVRGMSELLPVGLKGLMLTGMLAALASTVDTHLNWGSSYWTNDIYKRFICKAWLKKEPSSSSLVWVARLSNLLILAIALVIATQLQSIQQTWQISLLLGAGAGIVLILRWLWWRMTAWGEISAIITSLILAPILVFNVEDQAVRLLLIAGVSTLVSLLVVFFGPSEDKELLKTFYLRVKPPGFWKQVAEWTGKDALADKKHFYKELKGCVICALSLFSMLVGLGSWLVKSPPPIWFPWSGAWSVLLIVIGLSLIPVWWKIDFGKEN